MKQYIFITSSVGNVGGAQMYLANKAGYLEKFGWQTLALSISDYPIYINYPDSFKWEIIHEFNYPIKSFNKSRRNKIINKIISKIDRNAEIVIECNTYKSSFWGELIAEKVNGKSVVFIIEEKIPLMTKEEFIFLDFKLKRKELLNSTERSLRNIFKGFYKSEYSAHNYHLMPYCSNVVSNVCVELPDSLSKGKYNIISIGRLDKPYVMPMLSEVIKFASEYKNLSFNLIIIGNDPNNSIPNVIYELFKNVPNVYLYMLGFQFPIPLKWIESADVAIASSNSVIVSANEGIPTIAIDSKDFDAIGIYGSTTNNTYLRSTEPRKLISILLEDVLIRKVYTKTSKRKINESILEESFRPHIELLNISSKEEKYFNVNKIYTDREKFFSIIKRKVSPYYFMLKSFVKKKRSN